MMNSNNNGPLSQIVEQNVFIGIVSAAYVLTQAAHIYVSIETSYTVALISLVLIIIFSTRVVLFYNYLPRFNLLYHFIPISELILLTILYTLSSSSIMIELIYAIYISSIILTYQVQFSLAITYVGYFLYYYQKVNLYGFETPDKPLAEIFIKVFNFSMLVGANIVLKLFVERNAQIKALYQTLEEKNKVVEEITLLKERNRIASEMHDTVGHTLTTTIVEIEAAKLLIQEDPIKATEKITMAGEQIRKGLEGIRHTVRRLKDDGSFSFSSSINALIDDTAAHTGIPIETDILYKNTLLPLQEKVLYNAIKEAITNALRHSQCTEILLSCYPSRDHYVVSIIDNGVGGEPVEMGFGLKTMKDNIHGIGGTLDIVSRQNDGFNLTITLPMILEEVHND